MNQIFEELLSLFRLNEVETNVYEGRNQDLGFPNLFGGQVLGQALMAAGMSIQEWFVHSLHAFFLRPGKISDPVYYEVDLIRTGKSFATRRVVAKQFGRAILNLSASFHKAESGFEHQVQMPSVPGPDGLPSEVELVREQLKKIPSPIKEKLMADRAIEIRVIDPINYLNPHKRPAQRYSWMRAKGTMPENPLMYAAILAYASDFGLATTSLLPHGVSFIDKNMQVASLDHAMWFHRPFKLDDWFLYAKDAPSASGARGFNRGQIFSKDGLLIASVAQESLIRAISAPTVSSQ